MIPVTKTFLPNIDEYNAHLKIAWDKQWITNRGELVIDLEDKLKTYLDISNIIITNNGTIPLQIALKIIGDAGEIITTPFSYVATTAAIMWQNFTPVFVDITPDYWTIDEEKIEAAITSTTKAILATHVFGNPCNVEAIELIAKKHGIKVIYDAAHCFSVKYKSQSIFNFGDMSTCSFHATKIFHTGEGGAMFCNDSKTNHKLFYSHNFGHNGAHSFHGVGINGKISELQAAMGLAMLPHMSHIITERKKVVDYYSKHLKEMPFQFLKIREYTDWNYSYYPIVFKSEEELLRIEKNLNNQGIFPRRYFFPSLNTINYSKGGEMPISESIAKRIMCLPLYVGLNENTLQQICDIIKIKD